SPASAPPSTSRAWSGRRSSAATSSVSPGRSSPRGSWTARSSSSRTRRGRSNRARASASTSGRARSWRASSSWTCPSSDRARRPPRASVWRRRGLLDGLVAQGRVLVVDREWYLHSESSARLRALVLAALEAFHRANPLKPGMSREELRVRTGGADERVFATLLAALEAEGALASDRDKVRLASHQVRLTPEQQRIVDRVEQE